MTDIELLEDRLSALERTVVEGEYDLGDLGDVEDVTEDIEQFEARLEALEDRIAALEASVQSIEGYVSRVEAVNDAVEQQANAAVASVERLETRIDTLDTSELDVDELREQLRTDGSTETTSDGPTGPFDEVAVDEWAGEGPTEPASAGQKLDPEDTGDPTAETAESAGDPDQESEPEQGVTGQSPGSNVGDAEPEQPTVDESDGPDRAGPYAQGSNGSRAGPSGSETDRYPEARDGPRGGVEESSAARPETDPPGERVELDVDESVPDGDEGYSSSVRGTSYSQPADEVGGER